MLYTGHITQILKKDIQDHPGTLKLLLMSISETRAS